MHNKVSAHVLAINMLVTVLDGWVIRTDSATILRPSQVRQQASPVQD